MSTIAVGPALFKNYNTFLTWSVFAIVTWVTLLIGFPFTLQYAREQAEVWDHPLFMHFNVILTVSFGPMFTVNAGFGVISSITGICSRRACSCPADRVLRGYLTMHPVPASSGVGKAPCARLHITRKRRAAGF